MSAVMLLPEMKGSPLLVRGKIARTIDLQESIGKVAIEGCNDFSLKSSAGKASSEIANSHCAETLCPFVLV
ncbi:hypothetical protein STEG23_027439 [Scotinomys teguina]